MCSCLNIANEFSMPLIVYLNYTISIIYLLFLWFWLCLIKLFVFLNFCLICEKNDVYKSLHFYIGVVLG